MFSDLIGKKRIIYAACMLLTVGSVAGCGASSAEKETNVTQVTQKVQSVSTPNSTDFEMPQQIPNILVNQIGYNIGSEKNIIFRGKKLPENYEIKELESGETVYTGEILKPELDEESGIFYGNGRFGDFNEPGKYYIYADYLGESYSFEIGEDVYGKTLNEACKKYYINRCGIAISEVDAGDNGHSACHTTEAHFQENMSEAIDVTGGWHLDGQADRDTNIGSYIVDNLLLAYEMNPDSFSDDEGMSDSGNGIPDIIDEAKYEVDWMLKMQDAKTGGVYGAALTNIGSGTDVFFAPVEVTPVSMEATINFASAVARFSYLYKKFDANYAKEVLRAADRAFESFLNNQKAEETTAAFKAAAQLYRTTGNDKYLGILESYFNRGDFTDLFNSDDNIFLGSIVYLSTNQEVDKDDCEIIMKALMKKSENIAKEASSGKYHVVELSSEDSFVKVLEDMRCMTITNHIIYNYEYRTIIENHAHYMMGLNPECMNYVTASTERTYNDYDMAAGVMNNPQYDALLILLLSAITD
ncbi:glycoside hydrolase family 9 protein [Butyrivibrio sp. YAB3001]|uniref:glycoside hydrolase family 9 protein n=1 Tax=Butyrivibrio sp. YAB3001 TaxID=1520812 RepID=UPI0008F68D05|nr:glycoside hydrolase family 9 protein [Butyrivibrio sp. YAB3001]SFC09180.1 endoglucanase [Butyrivibrio sp. YAB3001]